MKCMVESRGVRGIMSSLICSDPRTLVSKASSGFPRVQAALFPVSRTPRHLPKTSFHQTKSQPGERV